MEELNMVLPGSDCVQCGHPFDPHVLWAAKDNVMGGGTMTCPVEGCECLSTWDVKR